MNDLKKVRRRRRKLLARKLKRYYSAAEVRRKILYARGRVLAERELSRAARRYRRGLSVSISQNILAARFENSGAR